jgi:hypothetical protein
LPEIEEALIRQPSGKPTGFYTEGFLEQDKLTVCKVWIP